MKLREFQTFFSESFTSNTTNFVNSSQQTKFKLSCKPTTIKVLFHSNFQFSCHLSPFSSFGVINLMCCASNQNMWRRNSILYDEKFIELASFNYDRECTEMTHQNDERKITNRFSLASNFTTLRRLRVHCVACSNFIFICNWVNLSKLGEIYFRIRIFEKILECFSSPCLSSQRCNPRVLDWWSRWVKCRKKLCWLCHRATSPQHKNKQKVTQTRNWKSFFFEVFFQVWVTTFSHFLHKKICFSLTRFVMIYRDN